MLKWLVSNNVLCHTVAMTWICSEVYIPNNLREWWVLYIYFCSSSDLYMTLM